jgi:3-oxoacyl-[acyl-carrier-protein] synthase-3
MTNHDFARVGIETSRRVDRRAHRHPQRHIARDGESTCSMAADAARTPWRARASRRELDAILLSTATPDRLLPSTAVDVQARSGRRARRLRHLGGVHGLALRLTVAGGASSPRTSPRPC